MTSLAMRQMGFFVLGESVPFWVKSNLPGPSVVPPAKEWPKAAEQVVKVFRGLNGDGKVYPSKFW